MACRSFSHDWDRSRPPRRNLVPWRANRRACAPAADCQRLRGCQSIWRRWTALDPKLLTRSPVARRPERRGESPSRSSPSFSSASAPVPPDRARSACRHLGLRMRSWARMCQTTRCPRGRPPSSAAPICFIKTALAAPITRGRRCRDARAPTGSRRSVANRK